MWASEWIWNDFSWWKIVIVFAVGAAAILLLCRLNRKKA